MLQQQTEVPLQKDELVLVPTEAIPINERLDDGSDHSTVYSGDLELALDAQEDFEQQQLTEEEIAERLLSFGLDRDGLPVRADLLFADAKRAADFQWCLEDVSRWQKWRGFEARPVEVPHVVLWDFFGGTSCLDLNCSAGDIVHVVAEEYQVQIVGETFKGKGAFMRLPHRWSFARWLNNKPFQPVVGLIPSAWLVNKKFYDENRRYFKRATWFLGIADVSTAYETILEDRSSYRAGLFVIFSPKWLNLDPADHRPFVLLLMCRKANEYVRETVRLAEREIRPGLSAHEFLQSLAAAKSDAGIAAAPEAPSVMQQTTLSPATVLTPTVTPGVQQATVGSQPPTPLQPPTRTAAGADGPTVIPRRRRTAEAAAPSDGGNSQAADPAEFSAEHVSSPYYLKSYTIRRSSLGRYLLFGCQYESLYDLVYHLSNSVTPLPHLLDGGPLAFGGGLFNAVPPPVSPPPRRDVYALTMNAEQVAARHFDQARVTEPALLRRAFDYVYRSIFNPFKRAHAEYAQCAGLPAGVVDEARAFCSKFQRPDSVESAPAASVEPVKEEQKKAGCRRKAGVIDRLQDLLPLSQLPADHAELRPHSSVQLDAARVAFREEDVLGAGAFATVFKGRLHRDGGGPLPIAIKKLRVLPPQNEQRQAWVAEMEVLQIVSHPNVARFFGFCFDAKGENAMLAFEFMDCGALSDFLKNRRFEVSANEQVDFLTQIARGMSHLHALDPPIIHGDLAARNVLMAHHPTEHTRYVLKVSDFGLSKTCRHDAHVYPDDPHKLPFKWLPPEVLHRSELSVKADVWAFGMTAMEVCGVLEPYGIMGADKVLPMCKEGHRMERPSGMPAYLYDLVLRCWRFQPVDRLTFVEIVAALPPLHIEHEAAHVLLIAKRAAADKEENEKAK